VRTGSAGGGSPLKGTAFRREGLAVRALPFLLVATVAEASLFLEPGPASTTDAVISVLLLAATAACFLLPWGSLPSWVDLIVPLLFSGYALALMLAAGGSTTGIGIIVLLPIVWTALYVEPWKSIVVVAAVVAVATMTTYLPVGVTDTIRVRKIAFFAFIGALVAYSIVELRQRMTRSNEQNEASKRAMASTISQLVLLAELADMLHSCAERNEAYEVIAHSAEKMFPVGGSVSILSSSRDVLETMAAWGNYASGQAPFSPHDCWALRRGHVYVSKPGALYCAHLDPSTGMAALCRPLLAQGELIGVLSIALAADVDAGANDAASADPQDGSIQQLALTVAEQIAMSMANFTLRDSLRNLSIRDPLTDLYNRRYMEETLKRELSSAVRSQDQLTVLQIDVDHFKDFNDTYGHEVGDAVLKSVGEVLLLLFRESDVPCRSGGEEFTVILPNCAWADGERRAQELQLCVAELDFPFKSKAARPTPPTLSIGIASSPEHGNTATALLRAADQALYAAKAAGRDRIVRALNPTRTLEEMGVPLMGDPPPALRDL
jgi:diguanylate cyclase (GGDEF)-like protein